MFVILSFIGLDRESSFILIYLLTTVCTHMLILGFITQVKNENGGHSDRQSPAFDSNASSLPATKSWGGL